jgi:hypothetical protein
MIDLKRLDKFYIDDFVKDIFIGFLQQLFNQNPGEFHYDADETVSKIAINDQFSYDNLTPEFKPTIYIRRRPFGFMNTSIDQLLGRSYMTSRSLYTDMITGVVELVCVSREGLEACRLASIVFLLINEFVSDFRRMGMHDVAVKSLGEEEPKDVRSTFRVVEVPVVIQTVFQYTWMMETMNLVPLGAVDIGRGSDPITGKQYTGAIAGQTLGGLTSGTGGAKRTDCAGNVIDGAGNTGVTIGNNGCDGKGFTDCPDCINDDGSVTICLPFSDESPKNPK